MATQIEVGTLSVRIGADFRALSDGLAAAGRAVGEASGRMTQDFALVERSADLVFDNIGAAIGRMASGGRTSLRDMVDAILSDLRRLAIRQFITEPLKGVVGNLLGSVLPFGGRRAAGGPVDPGHAFLVGEQGPELFVPPAAGRILPRGAPAIIVNIQARDADSVLRAESQVAAMMTRALARGQRNL